MAPCLYVFFYSFIKLYVVFQDPCLDGNSLDLDHMVRRSPSDLFDYNDYALYCKGMNIQKSLLQSLKLRDDQVTTTL